MLRAFCIINLRLDACPFSTSWDIFLKFGCLTSVFSQLELRIRYVCNFADAGTLDSALIDASFNVSVTSADLSFTSLPAAERYVCMRVDACIFYSLECAFACLVALTFTLVYSCAWQLACIVCCVLSCNGIERTYSSMHASAFIWIVIANSCPLQVSLCRLGRSLGEALQGRLARQVNEDPAMYDSPLRIDPRTPKLQEVSHTRTHTTAQVPVGIMLSPASSGVAHTDLNAGAMMSLLKLAYAMRCVCELCMHAQHIGAMMCMCLCMRGIRPAVV